MKDKKKRKYTKQPTRLKVSAAMRENPDARKIARAVVELAERMAKDHAEQDKAA